jgi:hypothetical protein
MFSELRLYLAWRSITANWTAYRKDHPLLTISQVLKSRTFWTLVLLAAFNGLSSITTQIHDPHLASAVNGVLSLAAIYFRIAPHQNVEKISDVGKPR